MRGKRVSSSYLLLAGALFLIVSSSNNAFGTLVHTRLIDTSFILHKWYDYTGGTSGHLNFDSTSINGTKKLYTYGDVYTLDIVGTFTFISDLGRDYSSSGDAKGYFEGGATVKIHGGLKLGGQWVYGGTGGDARQIFEAVMVPLYEDSQNPAENRWALEEKWGEEGRFNRTLFLDIVAGSEGLASGITIGSDILLMTGPKMDLSLKADSAANFYEDLGPSFIGSPIKITGTPEPATVLLLGLGALWIRRRK